MILSWSARELAGEIDSVALWCPSRADEPGFREWFLRAGQVGASPRMAERAYPEMNDEEIRQIEEAASRVSLRCWSYAGPHIR